MSSTRALRLASTSPASRPSLSTAHRARARTQAPAQPARPATAPLQTRRHYAAKGDGEKDDLGGPGGQEPPDPEARAQQNASLRNTTLLGMLLAVGIGIPFFHMVGRPDRIAERQLDDANNNRPAVPPLAVTDPGQRLAEVQGGGLPGGRQEHRNQWQGHPAQGTKAIRRKERGVEETSRLPVGGARTD